MRYASEPFSDEMSADAHAFKQRIKKLDANGDGCISKDDEMSVEEFKQWIKKFDTNCDGRISKDELREAIRSLGKWFSGWKSRRGILEADRNHNGVIDDEEIAYLIDFARKTMGMKIAMY